jgi:hypothetical protein
MTERTVQDVFDEERKNRNRIEELEEEIECVKQMKEELKECKKKAKILKTEKQSLKIDLLKEGKLEWVECGLDEWREYVENNFYDPAKYYIGEFKLDPKHETHFQKYFDDYFYYGSPNYQDENHPNADGSECYLAFGGGAAGVTSFEWN